MPYQDNRGFLGRWRPGPFALGPDMRPAERLGPAPQQYPPQGQMPWDQSQGQGFADLYAGKPKRPQPAKPATAPANLTAMFNPQQPPMPDFQMPPIDPTIGVYGQQPGNNPEMGVDPSVAAYDPAMAAYPGQTMRQPQPGDQATGANAGTAATGEPKGDEKFFGFSGMDWITMGMSLMAGANQNGGDWSMPMQAMQGIQQNQRQDKRLAVEDQRYKEQMERQARLDAQQSELHGLQVGELKYTGAQRERIAQAHQAAIESTQDPELKAVLAGMSPEQYGAFLGQRIISKDEMEAQIAAEERQNTFTANQNALNRQFQASQGAADRANARDVATLRNPNETARGRADLAQLAPWQEAAGLAQTYTLGRVQRMKEIITQLAAKNGVNQPMSADDRITLGRWGLADKETEGLLQEYKQLLGQFTRDEAQKLKPVSNVDIEGIEKQLAGGDTEVKAAMRMLDRMEQEMQQGISRTNAMVNWFDSGNSFSGRNAEGKTFYELNGYQPMQSSAPAAAPAATGGATASRAPAAAGVPEAPQSIPTNAILLLKQDPSPSKRKFFDQTFGPGAADRVLGMAQPGAYRGR